MWLLKGPLAVSSESSGKMLIAPKNTAIQTILHNIGIRHRDDRFQCQGWGQNFCQQNCVFSALSLANIFPFSSKRTHSGNHSNKITVKSATSKQLSIFLIWLITRSTDDSTSRTVTLNTLCVVRQSQSRTKLPVCRCQLRLDLFFGGQPFQFPPNSAYLFVVVQTLQNTTFPIYLGLKQIGLNRILTLKLSELSI